MNSLLWPLLTFFGDTHKIDTLLFGTLEDDCHGTLLLKVLILVVNFLLAGVLVGGTVGIIWSGVQIMVARDSATMVANGKKRIIDVLIGISAFVFMYVILNFAIPGGVTLDSEALAASSETCPVVTPLDPPAGGENPQGGEEPQLGGDNIEHGIRDFVMCGVTYNVVKVQVNGVKDDGSDSTGLKKFLTDKVQKYHINQSDGKLYDLNGNHSNSSAQDGHCDVVSKNFAHDMYYDTLTADSCSAGGGTNRAKGFSSKTETSFKGTYDEIMAGIPVVHRVTINDGGSNIQRHYAVIVGVRKGADRNVLRSSDFLFLETWGDGILWVNTSGVLGGYRTNAGGNGCVKVTNKNRFPYDNYYYIPTSKSGDNKMDCGH